MRHSPQSHPVLITFLRSVMMRACSSTRSSWILSCTTLLNTSLDRGCVNLFLTKEERFSHGKPTALYVASADLCLLRSIVGHDAVSINIENVAKLERDILDNVTLKLVTGAMSDLWHLQFSDARQRHAFYQAMLVHNPYGIQGGMKPTTTHLFTAHFRAVLVTLLNLH